MKCCLMYISKETLRNKCFWTCDLCFISFLLTTTSFFIHGIIIEITPMQLSYNAYLIELQKWIVSIILEVLS